jgi:uncharacterized membrane protein YqhA
LELGLILGEVSGIQPLCESPSALTRELMIVTVYGALKAVQSVYLGMALKVVYRVVPTMPEFEDVSAP